MQPADAGALLRAWEHACTASSVRRPIALLSALSKAPEETLERVTVGRRDAQLLEWYEYCFGPVFPCLAACPRCELCVEFSLSASELRVSNITGDYLAPIEFCSEGFLLSFRPPTTADLAAAASEQNGSDIRRRLFSQCLLAANRADGATVAPDEVPDDLIGKAAQLMTEADPQADIVINLRCPQCAAEWEALFDVAAFFSERLHHWALHFLGEVHQLAMAYKWSEAEILGLSTVRRQAYLDLVRHE